MRRERKMRLLAGLLALMLLAGCGSAAAGGDTQVEDPPVASGDLETGGIEMAETEVNNTETSEILYVDETVVEDTMLKEEAAALENAPAALPVILQPVASGTQVKRSDKAEIDYSNTSDGYVMVRFTAETTQRLKVQVKGATTTYTYDLPKGAWTVFPLSDGNGSYKITVFENVTGTKYAVVTSVTTQVTLADEFAPFIRPNQYVDYGIAQQTIAKAAELTKGETDPLKKVEKIYNYVVKNMTYDKEKAATVKSGYLPVLDTVLAEKKGICFDYASLMTGMLRSQGVPCKLVVGYAGQAYHAWISVWVESQGWVEGAVYFDGKIWQRMDPTFASSGKQSASIMAFIGDGTNYSAKYLY